MAQVGYILGIQQEANRLTRLNPEYTAFANQVLNIAAEVEDEIIATLVKFYLSLG